MIVKRRLVVSLTRRIARRDDCQHLLAAVAGQLFVAWSLSREEGGNHEQLLARVCDAGLGGVILSLGTVDDAAALDTEWKPIILPVASDFATLPVATSGPSPVRRAR